MRVSSHDILGCVALGAALATTAQAAPVVLLSNDFTNATRVGTPPSVLGVDADGGTTRDWVGATNGGAAMSTGASATDVGPGINGNSLFITNTQNAISLVTTFGSVTLADGDKLSVTLNVRTTAAVTAASSGGAFRVGLFNTGAATLPNNTGSLSGDPGGGGTHAYSDDTGYLGYYSTNASALITSAAQERAGGQNTNLFASGTQVGAAGTVGSSVAADTTYAVTLDLLRSGANMQISTSFSGASVTSVVDATSPYFTFNEVGVFFGSAFGNSGTPRQNFVDDVVVTYTAVPEPTTLAALAGLALVGMKRRRA